MATVRVRVVKGPNDSADDLLRKFKKMVKKSEILEDLRKHEYFLKKSLRLKEKRKRLKIKLRNGK